MSDSDEKLLELLEEMGEDYYPLHEYPESYEPQNVETRKEYLAKIKQAFADAGYTQAQSISYATVMKDGVVNLVANPQNVDLMTGQEWYERFEKQYHMSADWIAGDPEMGEDAEHDVLSAAKRAAGISND